MKDQHLVLLRLLETELAKTILPAAGSDMSRQIATVSRRLLSRWLVEETLLPQLREEAITTLRTFLPALQGEIGADLYRKLEQCLTAATAKDWPQIETFLQQVIGPLLVDNSGASHKLAAQLIAVDSQLRDRQETAYQERSNAKPDDGKAFDLGGLSDDQQSRLLDFIKRRFPAETRLRIVGVKPIADGFSKQTIFIDLADNVELPARIVMRRDAPYETLGTSVTMEFPVIEKCTPAASPSHSPSPLSTAATCSAIPSCCSPASAAASWFALRIRLQLRSYTTRITGGVIEAPAHSNFGSGIPHEDAGARIKDAEDYVEDLYLSSPGCKRMIYKINNYWRTLHIHWRALRIVNWKNRISFNYHQFHLATASFIN